MPETTTDFDVVIIGAGPAGLSLAGSLADQGLAIALVERLPATALAAPEFDGREIALTHFSVDVLRGLGAWERIPSDVIAPLCEARVLNGAAATRSASARAVSKANGSAISSRIIRFAARSMPPRRTSRTFASSRTARRPGSRSGMHRRR